MSVLIWWISHCCVYWHQWIIPSWDSTLRRYSYFSPFQEDICTSEKVWFGGFMYMGFSDWPAFPPTVLPRRRNDVFGIYFIKWCFWDLFHLATFRMNSTLTMSVFLNSLISLGSNPKSKLFLCSNSSVSGPENRELSQHQEVIYPAPACVLSFRKPQLNSCHFNVHDSLMEAHLALDRWVQCQPLDCVCHMLESCFFCGGINLDDTENWKWNIVSWCLAENGDEDPEGMGKSTEWTNHGGKCPANSALNKVSCVVKQAKI